MGLISLSVTLESMECSECGAAYALAGNFIRERRLDNKSWKCPNDHWQRFTGDTAEQKIERLQKERDFLRSQMNIARQDADDQRASAMRERAKAKKLRKRIAAGVCPCCKRTFQELGRHMETKHPGYAKAEVVP